MKKLLGDVLIETPVDGRLVVVKVDGREIELTWDDMANVDDLLEHSADEVKEIETTNEGAMVIVL